MQAPKPESISQSGAEIERGSFPTLQGLGLSFEELAALSSNGYLARQERAIGRNTYWRLRFRVAGMSRTVYLGKEGAFIDQVRADLKALQGAAQTRMQLQRFIEHANRVVRDVKRRATPALEAMGFHFHGDTVRKSRNRILEK